MGRISPLDPARVKSRDGEIPMMVVDLRNTYPVKTAKDLGFRYACLGRGLRGEGESIYCVPRPAAAIRA
jgi:hypothetical protein